MTRRRASLAAVGVCAGVQEGTRAGRALKGGARGASAGGKAVRAALRSHRRVRRRRVIAPLALTPPRGLRAGVARRYKRSKEIDYYKLLNVSKSASGREIKRAYHKLAVEYHPDKNPDDREAAEIKFKAVAQVREARARACVTWRRAGPPHMPLPHAALRRVRGCACAGVRGALRRRHAAQVRRGRGRDWQSRRR
jgi:hypothetical protein